MKENNEKLKNIGDNIYQREIKEIKKRRVVASSLIIASGVGAIFLPEAFAGVIVGGIALSHEEIKELDTMVRQIDRWTKKITEGLVLRPPFPSLEKK
jgi:hypothetical protein